ncbi:MAG: hypothetical protein P1V81_12630 [Planctomycetota bacterium]|nr:hypothetical protein [Planctomycetota bacterium]
MLSESRLRRVREGSMARALWLVAISYAGMLLIGMLLENRATVHNESGRELRSLVVSGLDGVLEERDSLAPGEALAVGLDGRGSREAEVAVRGYFADGESWEARAELDPEGRGLRVAFVVRGPGRIEVTEGRYTWWAILVGVLMVAGWIGIYRLHRGAESGLTSS